MATKIKLGLAVTIKKINKFIKINVFRFNFESILTLKNNTIKRNRSDKVVDSL
jgi:hypothetical protein